MTTSATSLDRRLAAISDPTRRRILAALKPRGVVSLSAPPVAKITGLCAGDIEERVRLSQPTISHHMAILTRAGLRRSREAGPMALVSPQRKSSAPINKDPPRRVTEHSCRQLGFVA